MTNKKRGVCQKHLMQILRALDEKYVRRTRPRKSPPGLVSGTAEYSRWWKAHNAERNKEHKRRARERRRAEWLASPECAAKHAEKHATEEAKREARSIRRPRSAIGPRQMRRQLSLALATPKWVDQNALVEIYETCAARRSAGEDASVDHIVPLNGALVSGLHVPWNLQIISRWANALKSTKIAEHYDLI